MKLTTILKLGISSITAVLACGATQADKLIDLGPMVRPVEYRNDGSVLAIDMNDQVPFLWVNGNRIDLPAYVGAGSRLPIVANGDSPVEQGVVASSGKYQVGWISDHSLEEAKGPAKRAAVWYKKELQVLPDAGLGGCARAVTNRGWVAGYVQTERTRGRAALWMKNQLTLLPDDGIGYSEAFALNNRGDVAGYALVANEGPRAVVWTKKGEILVLNKQCDLPEGWNLREADCINDRGETAGMAEVNGLLHGYILK